ncbi:hypothetical protein [Streptosporangium sp. NPDC051022]|uniref:hypothetical protein n=1 Tax=Streptosporangium sp. NPDC051022 TaxID=3155752 RepID=UPI00341A8ADE
MMMRRRPARPPGRHRDGRPHVAVSRRSWDVRARAEAERLDAAWPGWTVLYGAGSRCFHAIAAWSAPEPLIISTSAPDELERRMREVETAMLVRHDDGHGGAASYESRERGSGTTMPYAPYESRERGTTVPYALSRSHEREGRESDPPYAPSEFGTVVPHIPQRRETRVPYGRRLP